MLKPSIWKTNITNANKSPKLIFSPTPFHCFSTSGDQNFSVHTLLRLSSSSFPPIHHHYNQFFHLEIPLKTLAFLLIVSASALLFFLSTVVSLTYSSFHGFYGCPMKLIATLSSLSRGFLPLIATSVVGLLYISSDVSTFSLYEFLAWKGISLIGGAAAQSPTHSPYFLVISFVGETFAINWNIKEYN